MPTVKISEKPALAYLWHITEPLEKLLYLNTKEIQNQSIKYKNEVHRKQFLAKHLLLKELNLTEKISYQSNGKPVLKNEQYISISHSGPYVAIAISHRPIGIDIEKNQAKLKRIADRFFSHKDYNNELTENNLHWIWTAKESIYKLAGIRGLSFKNDIIIQYLDFNNFLGVAMLKNKKINLTFQKIDKDYLFCISF